MRCPNEYWLKYMLAHVSATNAQARSAATLYGFKEPDRDYLVGLRDKLAETKPSPYRKSSIRVKNWLRRQRIHSLSYDHPDAILARDYLGNTRLRPVLERLIMADTPRGDIPQYCLKITGVKTSVKATKYFEHYFWNRDLLTLAQWSDFLVGHPDRKLLLDCHERGPQFALWRCGYRLETDKEEIVRAVLHESSMRYFETTGKENTRDTALTAKMWSETVFRALEEVSKSGDAVQRIMGDLKSIAIKLERAEIKDIESLTTEDYAGDDE